MRPIVRYFKGITLVAIVALTLVPALIGAGCQPKLKEAEPNLEERQQQQPEPEPKPEPPVDEVAAKEAPAAPQPEPASDARESVLSHPIPGLSQEWTKRKFDCKSARDCVAFTDSHDCCSQGCPGITYVNNGYRAAFAELRNSVCADVSCQIEDLCYYGHIRSEARCVDGKCKKHLLADGEEAAEPVKSKPMEVLSRSGVISTIHEHRKEVRSCYDKERASNPGLSGTVWVDFGVARNGSVETAAVSKSTLESDKVKRCILRRIRTWRFPKTGQDELVTIRNYPFKF